MSYSLHKQVSVILVLLLLASGCKSERYGLAPGEFAPVFSLPTLSGSADSIKNYRGKVVVLNFWASWCAPCVAELADLQKLATEMSDKLTVVGVGIDDVAENLGEFKKQYGLTFPILVDENGKMKAAYKIQGVPETFIVQDDGTLVLFQDPEKPGEPTVRIVGPRQWHSDQMKQALLRISTIN